MSQRFNSAILHYKFKNVLNMFELEFSSFILGACGGLAVMGIIADMAYKAQRRELEEKSEADRRSHLQVVNEMESQVNDLKEQLLVCRDELRTQKNVVKTLGENNQRLLKSNKELKKCKHPNDETIAYMVSLYGNWFERSQEDHHLSPSKFIKKHWV